MIAYLVQPFNLHKLSDFWPATPLVCFGWECMSSLQISCFFSEFPVSSLQPSSHETLIYFSIRWLLLIPHVQQLWDTDSLFYIRSLMRSSKDLKTFLSRVCSFPFSHHTCGNTIFLRKRLAHWWTNLVWIQYLENEINVSKPHICNALSKSKYEVFLSGHISMPEWHSWVFSGWHWVLTFWLIPTNEMLYNVQIYSRIEH